MSDVIETEILLTRISYVKPPATLNWYDGGRGSHSDKSTWGASESDTDVYQGAISKKLIDTDSATMESTIALKAELGRLARALKQSEEREETLLSHIETQKSQISKLIERVPQPILINSPITNIVFTPYSKNADVKKRTGPALPSLDIDAPDENTDMSQGIVSSAATKANTTPSSYLIATAASSLLSLTPNKPDEQT